MEKCIAKLSSIFCALQNFIFFYRFTHFCSKRQGSHFEILPSLNHYSPTIITSRKVIIALYDAINDKSECAHLNNVQSVECPEFGLPQSININVSCSLFCIICILLLQILYRLLYSESPILPVSLWILICYLV